MYDERAAPLRRDPQNQYRYGVLIRNHVEDRYGQDLVNTRQVGPTHQAAKYPNWRF